MGTRDTPDYYCVFDGWVPEIYTSLSELYEQINEYEDCCWEKYTMLPEAEQPWLSYFGAGDLEEGKRRIMNGEAPDAVETDDFWEKQKIALRALHAMFHQLQHMLPKKPQRHHLVPETPPTPPLLNPSMRAYLDNACDNLHIPGPIYKILVQRVPDGRTCYCHLVSVMPPSSFEALVVVGRIAFDHSLSPKDTARLCIRELCKTNDTYIHDYNYDLAERWKQKYIDLCQETCTLEARLKDVTESNHALQERLFTLDMLCHASHGAATSNGGVGGAST